MQTEEQLADLPEALPLRRVSAFWLVLALLQSVALVVLVLVLCVVGLAALRQRFVITPPMVMPMAPPAVARGGIVGGMLPPGQPDDEEPADSSNLPYPTREDLKQEYARGPGKQSEREGSLSLRQMFFGTTTEVWQNTRGFYPSIVVVSPDGESLAFPAGENLMAGGFLDVRMWGDTGLASPGPGGIVRAGQAYVLGRARTSAEAMEQSYRRLQGGPCWSSDGKQVVSARSCGQLVRCLIGTQPFEVLPFAGDSPALLPDKPNQLVFVRSQPRVKLDENGGAPVIDLTEVVLGNLTSRAVKTLVPPSSSSWTSPSISWDGKQLAIVSDRGSDPRAELRWRVFIMPLSGGTPEQVTLPAAIVGPICWAPDGKAVVYARSQEPLPAEFWTQGSGTMYRTLDLFHVDLATKRETRVSRGGGNFSPSMSRDGQLHFVSWIEDRAGANLRLRRVSLDDALAFAAAHPDLPARDASSWIALTDQVLEAAKIRAESDGVKIGADALAAAADAFATHYQRRFQIAAPASISAFDQQRLELQTLTLATKARERLALLLGVVEGEFLRRNFGARWSLTTGPLQPPARVDEPVDLANPFALAYQPFIARHAASAAVKHGDEQGLPPAATLLSDVLRSADGRVLVLTNQPAAAGAELGLDADLAKAVAMLEQKQFDGGVALLLKMVREKHPPRNRFLALHVARILLDHGRKKEVLELLGQQRDQPSHNAREYNLLGLAHLLPGEQPGDTEDTLLAIDAFKNALRCDLQFGPAYLNLAQAYQRNHDKQSARLCLLRYLRLQPRGAYVADAQRRLADVIEPEVGR